MRKQERDANQCAYEPSGSNGNFAVALRTPGHRFNGIDHGQETIQAHQNQGVDTNEGREVRQILNHATPEK